MEDVVAVEVTLHTGEHRYFLTWGRIFDPVDGTALAALVLEHAPSTELGGEPVSATVCPTLSEARDQPYFYEALIDFGWRRPQFGDGYEAWRRDREMALREGLSCTTSGEGSRRIVALTALSSAYEHAIPAGGRQR